MVEFQKTLWAGSQGRLLPLGICNLRKAQVIFPTVQAMRSIKEQNRFTEAEICKQKAGPALRILSPDGQATPGASASSSCSPLASGWDRSIGQTDEEGQRFRNLPGGEGASLPTCPGDKQLLLYHPWAQFQGQVN